MITREEAWIQATSSEDERETEWARTVVALYDANETMRPSMELAARFMLERDALALELRRLRAAEAPGTDDAAFEGTGWDAMVGDWWLWERPDAPPVAVKRGADDKWEAWRLGVVVARSVLAFDLMRAAVPGSV